MHRLPIAAPVNFAFVNNLLRICCQSIAKLPAILALLLASTLACQAQSEPPFDCQASTPHRAFDFWLGNWTVRDAAGKFQGNNEIRLVQNGCALEEQWSSASGGTGQSINFFHPGTRQWRQIWNDGGSSIIDISGGVRDGAMFLEGTIFYLQTNTEKPFRGSWTPLEDGRVRQFFEEHDEKGNWQQWFEGFYSPHTQ